MLKLLCKSLGYAFYQQHAAMLLVGWYLLFGAVDGGQVVSYHLTLAQSIAGSELALLLFGGCFFLYGLKASFFIKNQLYQPSYRFLKIMLAAPRFQQRMAWLGLYLFICLPVGLYGLLIAGVALYHHWFGVVGVLLVVIGGGCWGAMQWTFAQFGGLREKTLKKTPLVRWGYRSFWTWPLFYLVEEKRLAFVVTKLSAVLSLKAILFLLYDVGADFRVWLTAMLGAVLCHSVLLHHLFQFDARYLRFVRGLPIPVWKRLMAWLPVILLLWLPEFILLVLLTSMSATQMGMLLLFSLATSFAMWTMLLLSKGKMDPYLKGVFFLFLTAMWTLLAGYYFIFSLVVLSLSLLIFTWRYRQLEPSSV